MVVIFPVQVIIRVNLKVLFQGIWSEETAQPEGDPNGAFSQLVLFIFNLFIHLFD